MWSWIKSLYRGKHIPHIAIEIPDCGKWNYRFLIPASQEGWRDSEVAQLLEQPGTLITPRTQASSMRIGEIRIGNNISTKGGFENLNKVIYWTLKNRIYPKYDSQWDSLGMGRLCIPIPELNVFVQSRYIVEQKELLHDMDGI